MGRSSRSFEMAGPPGLLVDRDRSWTHRELRYRGGDETRHHETRAACGLGHEHHRCERDAISGAEERSHPEYREQR